MWGSLRLAPIILVFDIYSKCFSHLMFTVFWYSTAELPTKRNRWTYTCDNHDRCEIWPGIHAMTVYMLCTWLRNSIGMDSGCTHFLFWILGMQNKLNSGQRFQKSAFRLWEENGFANVLAVLTHINILKDKNAVQNSEFRWGETAESRIARRYTHPCWIWCYSYAIAKYEIYWISMWSVVTFICASVCNIHMMTLFC